MLMLPENQREALILIGAGGFSYEEAAEIIGVAVGTVKSRVSRARADLVQIFETGSYERDGKPVHEAMGSMLKALERLAA
jgi:RNA polymerase sigma-70 factor (ECF subfamily)